TGNGRVLHAPDVGLLADGVPRDPESGWRRRSHREGRPRRRQLERHVEIMLREGLAQPSEHAAVGPWMVLDLPGIHLERDSHAGRWPSAGVAADAGSMRHAPTPGGVTRRGVSIEHACGWSGLPGALRRSGP